MTMKDGGCVALDWKQLVATEQVGSVLSLECTHSSCACFGALFLLFWPFLSGLPGLLCLYL